MHRANNVYAVGNITSESVQHTITKHTSDALPLPYIGADLRLN